VILLVAVGACCASDALSSSMMKAVFQAKWGAFKATHGKDYDSSEDPVRMQKFIETTHQIEVHNERFVKGLETFHMAHNEMSDMTNEEYRSTKNGLVIPADAEEQLRNATQFVGSSGYGLPAALDWRNSGAVSSVKNQQSCGSCYSFSAAAALETAHFRKYNSIPDVSEQNIVDCTHKGNYGNNGCGGGWMNTAYKYAMDRGGLMSRRSYPYENRVANCRHNTNERVVQVQTYVAIPRGNENALLEAVATHGAVSIAYDAGTNAFRNYRGGVFWDNSCTTNPTHAVTIVGYGTENGVNYWTLKNSWGPNWGEKGYFRMIRGRNMCGVATWASYPIAR